MANLHGPLSTGEAVGGNYEIVGVAGSGGMGIVYRALDRRLHRTVALKFLPMELAASPRDRERFLREARMASSLDHPNIGVIHAIEETSEGQGFIVMAYYDGESLALRIRQGALSEAEAVDIAIQMAAGLAEAHAHNIIHRDIKPSNVMLTRTSGAREGIRVRIVDFGLAQVTNQQTATSSGTTGTINYMSPEQALEKGTDHRTDIWSLGVTLAEMLTGHNPFAHEGISATLLAILNDPPRRMDSITTGLQEMVYRALSKEADSRYQTMAELLADLERIQPELQETETLLPAGADTLPRRGKGSSDSQSSAPASVRKMATAQFRQALKQASASAIPQLKTANRTSLRLRVMAYVALAVSAVAIALLLLTPIRERLVGMLFASNQKHIAVLPFENSSGTTEDAVLVAGLIDSLSDRLSNLDAGGHSLWVVPGSEVRHAKIDSPQQALDRFGATLVVKGSVNKRGQSVQLDVQLIDAKNLRQIGSVSLEDSKGNLGELETQAVTRLARLMGLKSPEADIQQASVSSAPRAYDNYLTALGYMQRYDKPGNLDLAIAALRKSIAIDAKFAISYAELGEALRLKSILLKNPSPAEAEASCRKALELNPDLAGAYVTLGNIHASQQPQLALQEFQHALALDAHNAAALSGMAAVYQNLGRMPEAEAALQKAVALRPEDWDGYDSLGSFYDQAGRYKEAAAAFEQARQLTPDNAQVLINLAAVYVDTGDQTQFPAAEGPAQESRQPGTVLCRIRQSRQSVRRTGPVRRSSGRYRKSAFFGRPGLSRLGQPGKPVRMAERKPKSEYGTAEGVSATRAPCRSSAPGWSCAGAARRALRRRTRKRKSSVPHTNSAGAYSG